MLYSLLLLLNTIFNRKYLVILITLFSINIMFAQRIIKGDVVDSDQDSLPYATVNILNHTKNKILKSTTTNDMGLFEMLLDSSNTNHAKYIYATYLNYISDTIQISKNNNLTLVIKNSKVINLLEVVVQGDKPSLIRKADRFIYTPSKSLTEGASTLDIIKIAPLINYDIKNDLFSIINKENTTVIINDRKSNLPKDMIISILRSTPAKNIKNIEIIMNPGSEYSANTTGGVININLKKNIDEGLLGNIVLTSQQSVLNTSIFNGTINYRKGKIGVRISPFINNSFNYNSSNNLIETSNNRMEETIGDYKRRYLVLGGGFGVDYDINSRSLLSINGFISTVDGDSKQTNITSYFKDNISSIDSIYSSPISSEDSYLYNFGNIYYQHNLDTLGKKKIVLNVDYNQFKKENTDLGSFQRNFPTDINPINTYKNIFPQEFFNISGSVDYSSQINKKSKINFGGQISTTNFDNDLSYFNLNTSTLDYELDKSLSNTYKYLENYFAIYVSKTKTFNEKINATFGLRVEGTNYSSENKTIGFKIDSSYVNIFPNISLAYTIKKNNTISIALAKRIKRPSIELLLPGRTYYNPNYFNENNPFLQPIITYNIDIMYALKNKYYFSSGYSFLDNQYSEFIVPVLENGEIKQKRTYINYGDSRKAYFQLYTKQRWFNNFWEMSFSTSLNIYKYNDKSENLLDNSRFNSFNYNISMNNVFYISKEKKMLAFAVLKYNSPFEDISTKRENALFKSDIGFRKTWEKINLTIYLSDIFNTYGSSTTTYHSNQAQLSNQLIKKDYTRSISLSLRYSFGNTKLKTLKNKKSANQDLKKRIN